jgi:hypothetical protein
MPEAPYRMCGQSKEMAAERCVYNFGPRSVCVCVYSRLSSLRYGITSQKHKLDKNAAMKMFMKRFTFMV